MEIWEEAVRCFFTRISQERDNGLWAADLWFRELEQIVNIACSTMDCAGPCGESDFLAFSRNVFVDPRDMVWTVDTVEIDEFRRG